MSDIPHLGFIVAAYGVTLVVLGGTVLAILLDGRSQKRLLAKLEQRAPIGRIDGPGSGEAA